MSLRCIVDTNDSQSHRCIPTQNLVGGVGVGVGVCVGAGAGVCVCVCVCVCVRASV